jgi:hypothetical protein
MTDSLLVSLTRHFVKIMQKSAQIICGLAVVFASAQAFAADEVRYFEKDGVTYQETRRVIRRPITDNRVEPREQTIYREKYSTDFQSSDRRYMAPVTEYQWQPEWVTPWNPFSSAYVTYRWVPVTRWVEKNETVRIPVTRRDVVPEKITTNVVVPTQRFVEDEYVTRVAVGSKPQNLPGLTDSSRDDGVARRSTLGGVHRLDNDPPRDGDWRPATSIRR